jgi:cell division protein FtsZ
MINLDFADVKAVMLNSGLAHMGIGKASGENKAEEAAKQAIQSPLLETSIEGARRILINVTGGPDLGLFEINMAADIVAKSVDPDALVIFGASIDENLKDEMSITVIATSFEKGPVIKKPEKLNDRLSTAKPQMPGAQNALNTTMEKPVLKPQQPTDELDIPTFLRRNNRFK